VASVLMHAWSEVEHDLVYKPYQGQLSEDEYAILDELNGMVMAGEIALERLQRAGAVRVTSQGRTFANHYELAAYLLSALRELADASTLQSGLGRVDLLYDLLDRLSLSTPDALGRYLAEIHSDLERRPIADQVVDQILSEDYSRYGLFEGIRAARPAADVAPDAAEPIAPDVHEAMGEFLAAWIDWERFIRERVPVKVSHPGQIVSMTKILNFADLDPQMRSQYDRLRRMRNQLVHGIETPDQTDLREAAQQLRELGARLDSSWQGPA